MPIEKVLVYANEYAISAGVTDISSLDFSDLEKEESYRKDNSELKADVIREVQKRINALGVPAVPVPEQPKDEPKTPETPKKKYVVKQPVLHSGVTYVVGEDVTDKIEQKSIDLLLQIGAVVEG
jgi:hypothetical protein